MGHGGSNLVQFWSNVWEIRPTTDPQLEFLRKAIRSNFSTFLWDREIAVFFQILLSPFSDTYRSPVWDNWAGEQNDWVPALHTSLLQSTAARIAKICGVLSTLNWNVQLKFQLHCNKHWLRFSDFEIFRLNSVWYLYLYSSLISKIYDSTQVTICKGKYEIINS